LSTVKGKTITGAFYHICMLHACQVELDVVA